MSAVSVSDTEVRSVLAEAVDLARRALLELESSGVGAYVGVRAEDECAATHCFEATLPGYHGWQWAVVVAAAPDADRVTVSESALLPGPDALIAPEFVPWEQRIRPGDLAPGDLLAPPPNDPRLAPGYTATGDPEIDEVAYQLGLGRKQVLSREGRAEAAQRWYEEYGPDSDMARAAPASCASCGFYLPLAGALRAAFGVCGNAMGADGHVVHMGYGCGAHSETSLPVGAGSPQHEAYDDAAVEVVRVESAQAAENGSVAAASAGEPAGTDNGQPSDGEQSVSGKSAASDTRAEVAPVAEAETVVGGSPETESDHSAEVAPATASEVASDDSADDSGEVAADGTAEAAGNHEAAAAANDRVDVAVGPAVERSPGGTGTARELSAAEPENDRPAPDSAPADTDPSATGSPAMQSESTTAEEPVDTRSEPDSAE